MSSLWGKTSRPAPRVSTLVPFIMSGSGVQDHFYDMATG